MTDDDIILLVSRIRNAEGRVYARVPAVGGSQTVEVEPADVPLFLRDRHSWVAKVFDITADQLDLYEREGHVPRCGAPTQSKRPCRGVLAGDTDPAQFVRLHHRERCSAHA